MDEYREVTVEPHVGPVPLDMPPCDVDVAYEAVPRAGSVFLIDTGRFFEGSRALRYTDKDAPGRNSVSNHFQGIQRIGDRMILTAGDFTEPAAHLLIVRLEEGPSGQPARGHLDRILAIDVARPHPGGIQRYGALMGVPLEGGDDGASEVRFFCLENPDRPTVLAGPSFVRPGNTKASAVAITRLPDERFIVGVAWESSIDLYLSRDADITKGFVSAQPAAPPHPVTIDLNGLVAKKPAYQAIGFCNPRRWGTSGAPDGASLPMIGFRNTRQSLSNWVKGDNYADHIELLIPAGRLRDWVSGPPPLKAASTVEPRPFAPSGRFDGNFSAAVGLDVPARDVAVVYAAHHYRMNDGIHVTTYAR